MTKVPQEAQELSDEVFANELNASEKMTELYSSHDDDVAEEAIMDTVRTMLGNSEDPQRMKKIIMLEFQFGQSMGSERLAQHANKEMEGLEKKYGVQGE